MSVLFSPVGTADPITSRGDGPMLHLVRHLKPDKVVLFLSPKMREYQEADARYTAAIERLAETEGVACPTVKLWPSAYEDVYRFDHYIGEFKEILDDLCVDSPNGAVMVNVTSGTPGMQQALVALGSFGRLALDMYQVTTPAKGINGRDDREDPDNYDLDFMWWLNEELRRNDPKSCEWRGIRVETPLFADQLLRENVIKLVESYDYKAAYELANEMATIDKPVLRLIGAARNRLNLSSELSKSFKGNPAISYRPDDPLGEYLSVMEVRLEQGNWADFVRLLTPALTQISKDTLRESGIPEEAYLVSQSSPNLDWDKVEQDERLRQVLGLKPKDYKGPRPITSNQLINLVKALCTNTSKKSKITRLRDFESRCRNKLAHELHTSDRQTLERLGGMGLDEVLNLLFDLHGNVRPRLYASINRAIIERL